MPSQPRPIKQLLRHNAIRRERTGFRQVAEIYHCRSIDLACNDFFKERGIASWTMRDSMNLAAR
jgi:hypothetical protein